MRGVPLRLLSMTCALACSTLVPVRASSAQGSDTATTIRLTGFVDTYYAWDSGRPTDGERRFTTQAVRDNEANVNLAWLGVSVERRRARARVALQAGTSVQVNYAGEPRRGATSGPDVARFIQEASAGARLSEHVWIDAGIYASYIGLENWTSSDNPTYTRSLVADYSPYYLSGAKVTWQPSTKVTAQFHVMNGWQNIAESNRSKAIGARLDVALTPDLSLAYATFLGNERATGTAPQQRVFNQVMVKAVLAGSVQVQGQVDVGRQAGRDWYGLVAIARRPVTPRLAVVGRVERFADPDQVVLGTDGASGFVGNGASAGLDVDVSTGVAWRSEIRALHATDALFPAHGSTERTRSNTLLVTSLSVKF